MDDITLIFRHKVRLLERNELPAGMSDGIAFTSVCINTALYLPWLASQCLKLGIRIRRGIVSCGLALGHGGVRGLSTEGETHGWRRCRVHASILHDWGVENYRGWLAGHNRAKGTTEEVV